MGPKPLIVCERTTGHLEDLQRETVHLLLHAGVHHHVPPIYLRRSEPVDAVDKRAEQRVGLGMVNCVGWFTNGTTVSFRDSPRLKKVPRIGHVGVKVNSEI